MMTVTVHDYLVAPATPDEHAAPSLAELFEAAVARDPDAVAVVDGDRRHSWRQWRDQAWAMACGLRDLGIGPGDVVATHLPNSMEFLVTHVAVAAIGAVLLPVHLDCGRSDVEALVRRTKPVAMVLPARWRNTDGHAVGQALRTAVPELTHLLFTDCAADEPDSLDGLLARWAGAEPEPVTVDPDAPLVLVASSGTTSLRPKLCMHSHRGLLSNAMAVVSDGHEISSSDTMLSASAFSFLFGLLSVHVSIVAGVRQVLLPTWDVDRYATASAEATVLYAVPTQLRDILATGRTSTLREIRTAGAPVPEELVRALTGSLTKRVTVLWGMSEIGAGTYTRPDDPPEVASRTVGTPTSGARVRVVDGELQFRGGSVFRGYYGEPELTARAFTADGWLRTGDLASMDTAGRVTIQGRAAGLINVGGRKVNATEIEQLLADLEPLREAVLVPRADRRLGEVPVLVCAGTGLSLALVTNHLRAKGVASHQLPTAILVVDEVPRTPTGKPAHRLAQDLANTTQEARPVSRGQFTEAVQRVCAIAEKVIGHAVRPADTFRDNGFDSATGTELRLALAAATGLDLPVSLIFDHPTPNAVARLLTGDRSTSDSTPRARADADDLIAIIGMSCRLPGGIDSPEEFWELLAGGREARSELPRDRGWSLDRLYSAEPARPGMISTRHGGFLPSIADFDAEFFGIEAREARSMDPQQRILLETMWEALERTGLTADELRGSDTSVFVGMMSGDYGPRWSESPESYDGTLGIGTASSVASGRIAYLLGLHGTALTVDTACSSSLVATHLAGQALLRGETGLAVVAGVTVMSSPANLVEFGRQSLLAPDGRCKAFADDADGVGLSEGAGVLVLQRLSDARRQGRRVLAVIRGSALSQDGASNGITAPNGRAQELAIQKALRAADLTPSDVDVVEAHGTGTPLGDVIEIEALRAAYATSRQPDHPLWIGSVKSNLGHTQAAAGITSVIKLVLALQHGTLPRTLHAGTPRSEVASPLRLLTEPADWAPSDRIRRAAVSSFGISGTNAHLVLEEPPTADEHRPPRVPHAPLLLSAKHPDTLPAMATNLTTTVDIGAALATGRSLFPHRAAIMPDQDGNHGPALRALTSGAVSADVLTGTALPGPIAFVFPGHGTQWTGMAASLLAESSVFAAAVAECEEAFAPHLTWSLSAVLRGDPDAPSLEIPSVAQPATFAVSVALAALWRSYGVEPDAVVGHSQGEVAAAYVAGGLSLPDAARIVAARAAIVDRIAGRGAMASLAADQSRVDELVARWSGKLCVAVVNGPRGIVVSGDLDAVDELVAYAQRQGIRARRLIGKIAFHSHHLEEHTADLIEALHTIEPVPSPVPFFSATTGGPLRTERLDAGHWYRNLREPVDFASATKALLDTGHQLFVEVSAHPVITGAVEESIAEHGAVAKTVTSLRRHEGGLRRFLRSLAEAHVHGAPVDWTRVFGDRPADTSALPTYPFRRRRFWLDRAAAPVVVTLPVTVPAPRTPEPDPDWSRTRLLKLVRDSVAAVLDLDGREVAEDTSFATIGMGSLAAVEVRNILARTLGKTLPATILFDHGNPARLVEHLSSSMNRTRLGSLDVSSIGLGTSTWGIAVDADAAEDQLRAYLAAGGNLVDTADIYGLGAAEPMLGRLLRKLGARDEVVLATKAGGLPGGPPWRSNASAAHLKKALDNSLRNLHTDHVDLWQVHDWDDQVPLDETLSAVEWAVSSGRARHAGVCNYTGPQLAACHVPLASIQVEYSLLARDIEADLLPVAADRGIGVIAWGALGRSVLTGKYRQGVPADRAGQAFFRNYVGQYLDDRSASVVDAVVHLAKELDVTPAAVATAWVLTRPGVAAALVGARTTAQLTESLTAATTTLPNDALTLLDEASNRQVENA